MDRIFKDTPWVVSKLFSFVDGFGLLKLLSAGIGVTLGYLFRGQTEMESAIGAFVLIVVDTATGWAAAMKNKRPRTSAKLSRIITKLFGYLAVIAVASVVEQNILRGAPVVNGTLWIIIATEGYSIMENVERIGLGRFEILRRILGKVIEEDGKDVSGEGAEG